VRSSPPELSVDQDGRHPFVRFRETLFASHLLRERREDCFESLVGGLDRKIAAVDGAGFRETPLRRDAHLSKMFGFTDGGGIWIKDETTHVAGSHKARHLFGILLALEASGVDRSLPLAIASCGNAARAAACLARAADRKLFVFVPEEAKDSVVHDLRRQGTVVEVCRRGNEAGDPSVRRFREIVGQGAIPFTVQGTENALAIEGGESLFLEAYSAALRRDARMDHVFVQVGGGALAAACRRASLDARAAGWNAGLPRLHPVQTEGCHPLALAHRTLQDRIERGEKPEKALQFAGSHRSEFMRPWRTRPKSLARGILDDETYDWLEVLAGIVDSSGSPVVAGEKEIMEANGLANESQAMLGLREVSFTGSAGLAGLLRLRRENAVLANENALVVFTGARRGDEV
jgi:threonine synthase